MPTPREHRPGEADAVVPGVDPTLGVSDPDRALPYLPAGRVPLIALPRNHFWLDERGKRRLGPGRPQELICREAPDRVGVTAAEALFISGDPVADLPAAKRFGMGTAATGPGTSAERPAPRTGSGFGARE